MKIIKEITLLFEEYIGKVFAIWGALMFFISIVWIVYILFNGGLDSLLISLSEGSMLISMFTSKDNDSSIIEFKAKNLKGRLWIIGNSTKIKFTTNKSRATVYKLSRAIELADKLNQCSTATKFKAVNLKEEYEKHNFDWSQIDEKYIEPYEPRSITKHLTAMDLISNYSKFLTPDDASYISDINYERATSEHCYSKRDLLMASFTLLLIGATIFILGYLIFK